jgi:ABC-type Zn uptake system ZnuABC Zn-binding protein ZnuA
MGAPLISAVATNSIIEDLVRNVGGERVAVTSLLPRNGDAHGFSPPASVVKAISTADLIVRNGLGLEASLDKTLRNAGKQTARVLVLTDSISPLGIVDSTNSRKVLDPHAWWDLQNAIIYVKRIRNALTAADPPGSSNYWDRAERYARQLAALDKWALAEVRTIPSPRRKIVTNHDALQYLAARYGLTIVGTVIPGGGTEREPSAREFGALVQVVRELGVRAIFTENTLDKRLAQALASETGAKVAPPLFTDALGQPGGPGDTFVKAFQHNIRTFVETLR